MQLACRWTFGKIRFRVKRDGLAYGYPSSSEGCERRSQRLRSGKLFFYLRNRLKSLTGKNTTSAENAPSAVNNRTVLYLRTVIYGPSRALLRQRSTESLRYHLRLLSSITRTQLQPCGVRPWVQDLSRRGTDRVAVNLFLDRRRVAVPAGGSPREVHSP